MFSPLFLEKESSTKVGEVVVSVFKVRRAKGLRRAVFLGVMVILIGHFAISQYLLPQGSYIIMLVLGGLLGLWLAGVLWDFAIPYSEVVIVNTENWGLAVRSMCPCGIKNRILTCKNMGAVITAFERSLKGRGALSRSDFHLGPNESYTFRVEGHFIEIHPVKDVPGVCWKVLIDGKSAALVG